MRLPRWLVYGAGLYLCFLLIQDQVGELRKEMVTRHTVAPYYAEKDKMSVEQPAYDFKSVLKQKWQQAMEETRPKITETPTLVIDDNDKVRKAHGILINERTLGKGAPLRCGEQATIEFMLQAKDQLKKESTSSVLLASSNTLQTVQITLGDQQLYGLELGMIGMQAGGKRHIHVPVTSMQKDKLLLIKRTPLANVTLEFVVQLQKARHTYPQEAQNFHYHIVQEGQGTERVGCGDEVAFHYWIYTKDGKKLLYSNADKDPLRLRLNAEEIPVGYLMLMQGMALHEKRRAILTPVLQKTLKGTSVAELWPTHMKATPPSTWVVEVELLPFTKKG